MEQAEKAIEAVVKAGDNSDVEALGSILHPGFQNMQDGFFGERDFCILKI